MPTLFEWLRDATLRLRSHKRDAPRLCVELLAARVLECDRVKLLTHSGITLSSDVLLTLESLLERRLRGEPLAYILGQREFYGRAFTVSPATLIPRPETEHLVEAALAVCSSQHIMFADMGTGSGCIAVTLAAERPNWQGIAVDISHEALVVAASNAVLHGVSKRLVFTQANMGEILFRPSSLQLVVSNPPYISRQEYENLQDEIYFEPEQALVPVKQRIDSPAGMECLEALVLQAGTSLAPDGWLCVEHGWQQAKHMVSCLSGNTWKNISVLKDLARKDRITMAQRM